MAYVEQCLAPTLKRNDIVLPAYKVPGVQTRSKQPVQWCVSAAVLAGPDPIEMPFSKVKASKVLRADNSWSVQADRLVRANHRPR